MSNEHDDDEIRESIQCVAFPHSMGGAVLPLGYSILFGPAGRCIQVLRRGVLVPGAHSEAGAWSDAIAREKARREREGIGRDTGQETTWVASSASYGPAVDVAAVIAERDEARAEHEAALAELDEARRDLGTMRWARDMAAEERDEARAELARLRERLRGVQRWSIVGADGGQLFAWFRDDMAGPWVSHEDLAAIIGKDGET